MSVITSDVEFVIGGSAPIEAVQVTPSSLWYTAGTTPDKIKLGRSEAVNKYIKITGENIEGKTVTLELLNAMPVSSWSGAMGEQSETVGVTVNFYLLQSADGSGDEAYLSPAF